MKQLIKNYGVIEGRRPTDYVGGTLPYEIRNPSGDWTPFLPVGEIQRGLEDYMDCVSRSATNTIEIQEKQQTGIESNYCEREVALGSGTTRSGNYLYKVSDYIRNTGLGQQTTYPDSNGTWDEQYAPIPADIKAKLDAEKKDWMSKWEIRDEDIAVTKASLQYHLKHAPIQVTIPGHAIVNIFSNKDIDRIFDSYTPFIKDVPGIQYPGPIVSAKKIVLYKKEQAPHIDMLLVNVKFGDMGTQIKRLRNCLIAAGWIEATNLHDVYDNKLAELVLSFQKANLSHTSWAYFWAVWYYKGRLVDDVTRQLLNNNLKK